jgi:hypothetical protein
MDNYISIGVADGNLRYDDPISINSAGLSLPHETVHVGQNCDSSHVPPRIEKKEDFVSDMIKRIEAEAVYKEFNNWRFRSSHNLPFEKRSFFDLLDEYRNARSVEYVRNTEGDDLAIIWLQVNSLTFKECQRLLWEDAENSEWIIEYNNVWEKLYGRDKLESHNENEVEIYSNEEVISMAGKGHNVRKLMDSTGLYSKLVKKILENQPQDLSSKQIQEAKQVFQIIDGTDLQDYYAIKIAKMLIGDTPYDESKLHEALRFIFNSAENMPEDQCREFAKLNLRDKIDGIVENRMNVFTADKRLRDS